jgi:hypothetical protein
MENKPNEGEAKKAAKSSYQCRYCKKNGLSRSGRLRHERSKH